MNCDIRWTFGVRWRSWLFFISFPNAWQRLPKFWRLIWNWENWNPLNHSALVMAAFLLTINNLLRLCKSIWSMILKFTLNILLYNQTIKPLETFNQLGFLALILNSFSSTTKYKNRTITKWKIQTINFELKISSTQGKINHPLMNFFFGWLYFFAEKKTLFNALKDTQFIFFWTLPLFSKLHEPFQLAIQAQNDCSLKSPCNSQTHCLDPLDSDNLKSSPKGPYPPNNCILASLSPQ